MIARSRIQRRSVVENLKITVLIQDKPKFLPTTYLSALCDCLRISQHEQIRYCAHLNAYLNTYRRVESDHAAKIMFALIHFMKDTKIFYMLYK